MISAVDYEFLLPVVAPKELLCYSLCLKTNSVIDHHLQNHDTLRSRLGSASVSYYGHYVAAGN